MGVVEGGRIQVEVSEREIIELIYNKILCTDSSSLAYSNFISMAGSEAYPWCQVEER